MNRKFIHIRTLQQRLIVFLLLPITLLLFGTGLIAFIYVKQALLNQWREAALLKLERAAHYIDMRLERPLDAIELFGTIETDAPEESPVSARSLERMRNLPGVTEVNVESLEEQDGSGRMRGRMMGFQRVQVSSVTQPEYDTTAEKKTVSVITFLLDSSGNRVGRMEIKIRFGYLMEGMRELGWQQSDMASLVDQEGIYILHIGPEASGQERSAKPGGKVEKEIFEAMEQNDSGTLLGSGNPPGMVAGYHRLTKAPWFLVLRAEGDKILAPIIRLRFVFIAGSLLLLAAILLLIRSSIGQMVRSINFLSHSAENVARGRYDDPVPVESEDEIGQLIKSYNTMVEGLKERDFIRNTFGRYMDEDVARELLRRPGAVRLGGDNRDVAILMSDIRGFTPLAETLSPDSTIHLLNAYFGHMIESIKIHQGIIVDFIGDALLAFFDPLDNAVDSAAFRGVCCALDMQGRMNAFNLEMKADGLISSDLEMGIALHTGEVVVGNIGSETRAKYGIVGSAVNMAQRIEGKALGGQIVVSEPCRLLVTDCVEFADPIVSGLKGVHSPVRLFPVKKMKRRCGACTRP